jgi:hypothetical protein
MKLPAAFFLLLYLENGQNEQNSYFNSTMPHNIEVEKKLYKMVHGKNRAML